MQPHTSYLVCGTPRSGSSLLCEALTQTGIAGKPEEYFQPANEIIWKERWGTSTYAEYLARTIDHCTTPNGVFGVKMMWGYCDHFLRAVSHIPDHTRRKMPIHTRLQAIFPNLHYIWIKRRDTLRQAISQAKALQTNQWVVRTDHAGIVGAGLAPALESPLAAGIVGAGLAPALNPPTAQRPAFSFLQIDFLVREIELHNAAWQRYFTQNGIQPLVIVYEDFVAHYEETLRETLQHLALPGADRLPISPVSTKKQADAQSEQWVQRYLRCTSQAQYRLLSHMVRATLAVALASKRVDVTLLRRYK